MRAQDFKALTNLLLTLLLALLLTAIWWFSTQTSLNQSSSKALGNISCDFNNQACLFQEKGNKVHFTIANKTMQSFEPLTFNLEFVGYSPETVAIDFQGIEMFMGANLLNLEKSSDNTFTGTHTLAGHAGMSMTWRAIVKFTQSGQAETVEFEFELE
ncbi:MAG: hypothetical protein V7784_04230 [Oceanospirillaceae bacterium]